jgi:septum formation protein
MQFILATNSPRRKELFHFISDDFISVDAGFNEHGVSISKPAALCQELAKDKALTVAVSFPNDCVLGFDTIVAVDDCILGKPVDKEDARQMLTRLSGRKHTVYTGVYIVCPEIQTGFTSHTDVYFRPLSEEMISSYINSNEPYDKAGGYSIQEGASVFCEKIVGDYYTVMGLPVSALFFRLKELGLR